MTDPKNPNSMNEHGKGLSWERPASYVLLLFSFALFFFFAYFTQGEDIWYDEIFSLSYAAKSPAKLLELAALDVHPPLYYFYLKAVSFFLTGIFSALSFVSACKIASLLPLAGLFLVPLASIRKRFGLFTASLFCFFLTAMPQLCNYYVEIRMYSLAMLFVTGSFFSMLPILSEGDEGKKAVPSRILFFLCGIFAAYTQYFACIAIIGIYLVFFFAILRLRSSKGTDSGKLRFLFLSAGLSVLCYLPWLPRFFGQVRNVTSSFWIQPMTLRSIPGTVKYIFTPVLTGGSWDYIPAGLMIGAVSVIILLFLKGAFSERRGGSSGSSVRPEEPCFIRLIPAFSGIFLIAFLLLTGFCFSLSGHPVFVYRYLLPALGIFWFGIAHMAGKCVKSAGSSKETKSAGILKKAVLLLFPLLFAAAFFFGGYCSIKGFSNEESKKLSEMEKTLSSLSGIEEDAVILTNFDHVAAVSDYCLNTLLRKNVRILSYEGSVEETAGKMLSTPPGTVSAAEFPEKMKLWTSEGRPVYFFGSFASREDLIAEWALDGIRSEETASCLLERYWFNIYRLAISGE